MAKSKPSLAPAQGKRRGSGSQCRSPAASCAGSSAFGLLWQVAQPWQRQKHTGTSSSSSAPAAADYWTRQQWAAERSHAAMRHETAVMQWTE